MDPGTLPGTGHAASLAHACYEMDANTFHYRGGTMAGGVHRSRQAM